MFRNVHAALAFFLLGLPLAVGAATWPEPVEGDHVIQNFRFVSGATLPELKLHYRR